MSAPAHPASRAIDPNVARLYRATFLFGIACGVSIALSSLQLDAIGFTKEQIGTLAAWFASGVVLVSLPVGALIRRFSARSTLLAALLGYAACIAAFPFLRGYAPIAAVRALDGACSVGIWISSEVILLSRADESRKAQLTSLYAVWLACGYIAGSGLAKLVIAIAPASGSLSGMEAAFLCAGALSLAAFGYVFATFADDGLGREPKREVGATSEPPASSWSILWRIKNSCFGTFAYGYFQASVVIFLPLYLIESKGVPRDRTIVIPGLFCMGMLATTHAAGKLADRVGHLLVMRLLAIVGTSMILGFVFLDSYLLMCGAVFVAGATLAALSPVSLALQGVVTEPKDYSRSNAIYNVFYAAGMLLGPPVSSVLFARHGGQAMLWHLVGLYVAFIVFTAVFWADDPAATKAARVTART